METLFIPSDEPVVWTQARAPRETPFGVMEEAVMQVEFSGRRFQRLEPVQEDGRGGVLAVDLDTGAVVAIRPARVLHIDTAALGDWSTKSTACGLDIEKVNTTMRPGEATCPACLGRLRKGD